AESPDSRSTATASPTCSTGRALASAPPATEPCPPSPPTCPPPSSPTSSASTSTPPSAGSPTPAETGPTTWPHVPLTSLPATKPITIRRTHDLTRRASRSAARSRSGPVLHRSRRRTPHRPVLASPSRLHQPVRPHPPWRRPRAPSGHCRLASHGRRTAHQPALLRRGAANAENHGTHG